MTDSSRVEQVRGLVDFAGTVLHSGDTLVRAGALIGGVDPGAGSFGGEGSGGFGELCRQLHRQWSTALDARATEANERGERLVDTAERLAKVAANYAETDIRLATKLTSAATPGSETWEDAKAPDRTLTVRPDKGV
ncbi:MAG: hypothetical protein ACRDT6_25190 [Micromonosporaceae bacterium]